MLLLTPSVSGLFKWRQFEPEVILLAVGWYLRFSLSYRDVEELLAERGLLVDHVTVWRWVQRYAPQIQRRLRPRLRPTNDSWRVDETYIRVKGKWVYLYRALDSSGATIDFLLSAKRDAAAAERFLAKALGGENHPAPRVINTDEHAGYPPAIVRLKAEGALEENCRHRPVHYLNNVLEQDHRAIKRRVQPDKKDNQGHEANNADTALGSAPVIAVIACPKLSESTAGQKPTLTRAARRQILY